MQAHGAALIATDATEHERVTFRLGGGHVLETRRCPRTIFYQGFLPSRPCASHPQAIHGPALSSSMWLPFAIRIWLRRRLPRHLRAPPAPCWPRLCGARAKACGSRGAPSRTDQRGIASGREVESRTDDYSRLGENRRGRRQTRMGRRFSNCAKGGGGNSSLSRDLTGIAFEARLIGSRGMRIFECRPPAQRLRQ